MIGISFIKDNQLNYLKTITKKYTHFNEDYNNFLTILKNNENLTLKVDF